MSTLTIRNLDPAIKEQLRSRAAKNGQSMEAEVRQILRSTLKSDIRSEPNLYERIRSRFAPLGGVDLDLPPRDTVRDPPQFE